MPMRKTGFYLCAFFLLPAACQKPDEAVERPASRVDVNAEARVLAALERRSAILDDFSYRGVMESEDGSDRSKFSFRFQQPGKMWASLNDEGLTYVFDGNWLAVIEHKKKRVLKQDISQKDAGTRLAALHELFRKFSVEGWRAPLLRMKRDGLGVTEVVEQEIRYWEIESPIDDGELALVRYRFSAPGADFVRKEFVNKKGEVTASTIVTKSASDATTQREFPVAWEQRNARGLVRIRLEEWQVNPGLSSDAFSVIVPDGYQLQVIAGQ